MARQRGRLHVVLSAACSSIPRSTTPIARSRSKPASISPSISIARGVWSLDGDAPAVYFVSIDPHQIALSTPAPPGTPRPWLSVSVTALCGFLAGGDVWGVLVGYSQKFISAPARRH